MYNVPLAPEPALKLAVEYIETPLTYILKLLPDLTAAICVHVFNGICPADDV